MRVYYCHEVVNFYATTGSLCVYARARCVCVCVGCMCPCVSAFLELMRGETSEHACMQA